MPQQTIIWTALPAGLTSTGTLRLTVAVAPRLHTDTGLAVQPLSAFGDFLEWPKRMAGVSFRVKFGDAPPVDASPLSSGPPLDPGLWTAIFGPKTKVISHTFDDLSACRVRSYPVHAVLEMIKRLYQRVAVDPATAAGQFPSIRMLLGDDAFGQILFRTPRNGRARFMSEATAASLPFGTDEAAVRGQIEAELAANGAIGPSPTPLPARDFLQALDCLAPQPSNGPLRDPRETLDFHQMVSLVGSYPLLLRRLGLAVDLEVVPPSGMADESTVAIAFAAQAPVAATHLFPRTRYHRDSSVWLAAPSSATSTLTSAGMLRLDDPVTSYVYGLDAEGLVLKLYAFVQALLSTAAGSTLDSPTTSSVPALRSAGLSVAQAGLAVSQRAAFSRQRILNQQLVGSTTAGDDVVLVADDLTAGYRIDVFDAEAKSLSWRSLCLRSGTYRLPMAPQMLPLQLDDEGMVELGLTDASQAGLCQLQAHEALFNWDGWSLSAPRPGQTIAFESDEGGSGPSEKLAKLDNTATDAFGLQVHFRALPHSLPRLRFGRLYQIRARAVDVAGNSRPPEVLDKETATQPVRYLRFEPVVPPELVMVKNVGSAGPDTPADSLAKKGDDLDAHGSSVERLVVRTQDAPPAPLPPAMRYVAPPKISQHMAELHGCFDQATAGGPSADQGVYSEIAKRDLTQLPGSFQPNAATVTTGYFPDPFAKGALLSGLPGMPAGVVKHIPFDGAWPDAQLFRVLLAPLGSGAAPPTWDGVTRTLTVRLGPAETTRIGISSFIGSTTMGVEDFDPAFVSAGLLGDQQLRQMGVWQWIEDSPDVKAAISGANPLSLDSLRKAALLGSHWMLTPSRMLTLIHAVQRPLEAPTFKPTPPSATFQVERQLGDTSATVLTTMTVSGKSTAKVDVFGSWDDVVDDPSSPAPQTRKQRRHLFQRTVEATDQNVDLSALQNFGDTRHRVVSYSGVASTRFREYFPPSKGPADPDFAFIRETAAAQMVGISIPSSGRPRPPMVRDLVPTFKWEDLVPPTGTSRTRRRTGGVRVYLERPWFSSGEGELLGVVLASGNLADIQPAWYPFFSRLGADPVWKDSPSRPTLSAADFAGATIGTNLKLEEVPDPNVTVTVAGYPVSFDASRQLWFADVELTPGDAYYPFARLALCRYQPESVDRAHLSSVTMADFIQLVPGRVASFHYLNSQATQMRVEVTGVAHHSDAPYGDDSLTGPNVIMACLEQSESVSGDELSWTAESGTGVTLAATSVGGAHRHWTGTLTVPQPVRSGVTRRLAIREYEQHSSYPGKTTELVTRLVYAEALALDL